MPGWVGCGCGCGCGWLVVVGWYWSIGKMAGIGVGVGIGIGIGWLVGVGYGGLLVFFLLPYVGSGVWCLVLFGEVGKLVGHLLVFCLFQFPVFGSLVNVDCWLVWLGMCVGWFVDFGLTKEIGFECG